jgi:hypothetical protein
VIDLLALGAHYFVVTAVNAYGESSYSNEITIKVTKPKSPTQEPSGEVEIDLVKVRGGFDRDARAGSINPLTDAGSSGEAAVSD